MSGLIEDLRGCNVVRRGGLVLEPTACDGSLPAAGVVAVMSQRHSLCLSLLSTPTFYWLVFC